MSVGLRMLLTERYFRAAFESHRSSSQLYHRFLYKPVFGCYSGARNQGDARKGYAEMFQVQMTAISKFEYLSFSLCSYAREPHGPLTRPYKTTKTDTVTR